jgi:drug/metabolite transporter (DMT)-like permease
MDTASSRVHQHEVDVVARSRRPHHLQVRRSAFVPVVLCALAALLFGASTPAAKLALGSLGPLTLAGILYLGAALAIAAPAWQGRSLLTKPPASKLVRIAAAVLLGGAVAPALVMLVLARTSAANVSLWLSLETVFTSVVATLFFREQLGLRAWTANALVFLASVLLSLQQGVHVDPMMLLVAAACVGWALDNNLTSVITELTPTQLTLLKGLCAGGLNLTIGLWREGLPSSWRAVAIGLGVGALGYGASLALYIRGARQLGAARSQMIFASAPFWGLFLSWLALGEPVTRWQIVAALCLLTGLSLLYFERHQHRHRHLAERHTHEHRHDDGHHTHQHPGLPPDVVHTHEHEHLPVEHEHPHLPDLHHRHEH